MPRNIEIKARIASVESLLPQAQRIAGGAPQLLEQDDTFFGVAHGRLKLREFADGSAELIHYQRGDIVQPRASEYLRVAVADPAALRAALERACGVLGRVRKRRWLLIAGTTRIHLDRVEDLGDYLEIEVVLHEGLSDADGAAEAERVLRSLGVDAGSCVAGAYLDLLRGPHAPASSRGIASARKS